MSRDVKDICRSCLPCQKSKHDNSESVRMCPMELGEDGGIPDETIANDIGTLPYSDSHGDNKRYFLLMIDLFTSYVELQPIKD